MSDTEKEETTIVNHYEKVPKKFKTEERHYATEKQIKIKLPFRMCVTGASGSGKTNAVVEVVQRMNAFDKIMIWAKDTEEELYAAFIDNIREYEKKHGASILTVSNTIADLPSVDSINKDNNTLLIIDDMVTEKDKMLARVSEFWIRGRKKNISSVFISQDYFGIPTLIRKNSDYFIFTKVKGDRDLSTIVKDFPLGITDEQVKKLYAMATKDGFPNFFMVDLATNDKSLRYRRNFKGLETPADTPNGIRHSGSSSSLRHASMHHRSTKQKEKEANAPETVEYRDSDIKMPEKFTGFYVEESPNDDDVPKPTPYKRKRTDKEELEMAWEALERELNTADMMGDGVRRPTKKRRRKAQSIDTELLRLIHCVR